MWKSISVPLAARVFGFIFIPFTLNLQRCYSITCFLKSITHDNLDRYFGFVLLAPFKINLSNHNPIISQNSGLVKLVA